MSRAEIKKEHKFINMKDEEIRKEMHKDKENMG
jgi:hypothetical protein